MAETLHAPIKINLSGAYVIPLDGQKPVAGSVSGDLRLATLDAFIQSLNAPLKPGNPAATALGRGFRKLKARLDPAVLVDHDILLEVTCTNDPATHQMRHTFRFCTEPKAKA